MIYMWSFGVFVALYTFLISLSIFLNNILNITPQVGLNVLALAFTTYTVVKSSKMNFQAFTSTMIFSILSAAYCVLVLFILSTIDSKFKPLTLLEACISFLFNTVVVFVIIKLLAKKHQ